MWLRDPLSDLLSSGAKVSILRVLSEVNAPLSGREIARRAGVWSSAASKALGELTASGVLDCRDHGRAKTYVLDRTDVALVAQLQQLFRAEAARFRQFVADMTEGVPEALSLVLFGSEARREANPRSDTDVLIVVARKTQALESRVLDLCVGVAHRYGLDLAWHVADLADLRDWDTTANPFWLNVQRDGVILHGMSMEALERRWQRGNPSSRKRASSSKSPASSTGHATAARR
jgi:predicted nucleotidyltransferase